MQKYIAVEPVVPINIKLKVLRVFCTISAYISDYYFRSSLSLNSYSYNTRCDQPNQQSLAIPLFYFLVNMSVVDRGYFQSITSFCRSDLVKDYSIPLFFSNKFILHTYGQLLATVSSSTVSHST